MRALVIATTVPRPSQRRSLLGSSPSKRGRTSSQVRQGPLAITRKHGSCRGPAAGCASPGCPVNLLPAAAPHKGTFAPTCRKSPRTYTLPFTCNPDAYAAPTDHVPPRIPARPARPARPRPPIRPNPRCRPPSRHRRSCILVLLLTFIHIRHTQRPSSPTNGPHTPPRPLAARCPPSTPPTPPCTHNPPTQIDPPLTRHHE